MPHNYWPTGPSWMLHMLMNRCHLGDIRQQVNLTALKLEFPCERFKKLPVNDSPTCLDLPIRQIPPIHQPFLTKYITHINRLVSHWKISPSLPLSRSFTTIIPLFHQLTLTHLVKCANPVTFKYIAQMYQSNSSRHLLILILSISDWLTPSLILKNKAQMASQI